MVVALLRASWNRHADDHQPSELKFSAISSRTIPGRRRRERQFKPRRADDATRITLVMLAQLIDWRAVLTIVQPATLIRWHRKGFRLFWRWKSRAPGRPPLPVEVQQLIAAIARALTSS